MRSRHPDLHALDAEALTTLATRITQADGGVRQVLAVVAPLAPPREVCPSLGGLPSLLDARWAPDGALWRAFARLDYRPGKQLAA